MRRLRALPLLCASICLHGADYFAAPSGRPDAAGSLQQPWSLQHALTSPAIRPGDTVWLRGGTYGSAGRLLESRLRGSAAAPVTLRQFPGERATILGGLRLAGENSIYWGFEILETAPAGRAGLGNKLVHLVLRASGERPTLLHSGAEAIGCLWYDEPGEPHFTDTNQPSPFEHGRTNVVARWNMATGRLEVDASDFLKAGTAYELYDARAFYAPPLARGVFNGSKISLIPANADPERRLLVLMPARKDTASAPLLRIEGN